MPLLNLLVIAYLAFMVFYWGSVQGVFSAFLHLVAVVAAGALALALWEPLVHGVLFELAPEYAWGLGLAGPFILLLLAFRVALDQAIRGNVYFTQLFNILAGGFLGLCSGMLTIGLVLIAVSHLPIASDFLGYQPALLSEKGEVVSNPGGGIWLGCDAVASRVFGKLSAGSLSFGYPVNIYRGNLADMAARARVRTDNNASIVATPATVSLGTYLKHRLPVPGLYGQIAAPLTEQFKEKAYLAVVDTNWNSEKDGTYDMDGALRISPSQVKLVAVPDLEKGKPEFSILYLNPKGVSVADGGSVTTRVFVPINTANPIRLNNPSGKLGWIFAIPDDYKPVCIFIRGLRMNVGEPMPAPADGAQATREFIAAVGRLPGTEPSAGTTALTPVKPGTLPTTSGTPPTPTAPAMKPLTIEQTSLLPSRVSANMTGSLRLENNQILSGRSDVGSTGMNLTQQTAVEMLYVPTHRNCIRVKVPKETAHAIFGSTKSSINMMNEVYVVDTNNEKFYPIGYVLNKLSGILMINVERTVGFRTGGELPISEMQTGEDLYLYFLVPKNTTIQACYLGPKNKTDVKF